MDQRCHQIFSRGGGGHNFIFATSCIGCLLTKAYKRGVTGTPGPPWLCPWSRLTVTKDFRIFPEFMGIYRHLPNCGRNPVTDRTKVF